jgi:SSS family solute:Na+ symporter
MPETHLAHIDLFVLVSYLAAVIGFGWWFARRGTDSDDFMSASRSLPGWAVGLSMFGSFVSSISFLANPGKSYAGDWNAFAFSLSMPIAAVVAVKWFVPFFRHSGELSAYEHLEHRFGLWARTYAVLCYLLTQSARMGTVVFLLGLAVRPLTGWPIWAVVLITGALMTAYTMAGGIKAVIWLGVLQSAVLVAGTATCLLAVIGKTPGGVAKIVELGVANDKFSLGSFGPSLTAPTFWVIFAYGIAMNLGNFGTDQGFIQRFITARSDREAAKSIWITAALFMPTSAIFFFIGTALYAYYTANPTFVAGIDKPDEIYPHFIATELPVGVSGLVVAAIFAAAMDSNLNSMATLTLCDLYKRYWRPEADDRESMRVLRGGTLFWGIAGTSIGLAMIGVKQVLDTWWILAGIFSGGVLGLVLLGMLTRASNAAAALATAVGVIVVFWMSGETLLQLFGMSIPASIRNPLDANLTIVVGTLTIFLVGLVASKFLGRGEVRQPEL